MVAGRADILLVPDIEAGNMVAKQLEYLADALMAGVVLGTRVPIVLTSRADSAETRAASCAIAQLIAHKTPRHRGRTSKGDRTRIGRQRSKRIWRDAKCPESGDFRVQSLLLLAMNASAEVYRWVDEHGVVELRQPTSAGQQGETGQRRDSRVSVVPAPAKPAATAPASAEQAALRDRLGRLESQLEEERRLRALAQAAEADQLARARADCEAQRRLNCDSRPLRSHTSRP